MNSLHSNLFTSDATLYCWPVRLDLLPLAMNIIVPTYHCRLWWVRACGKFTQTYLSKLVNNFIILPLPDSQMLLQVKHRVLDGECN